MKKRSCKKTFFAFGIFILICILVICCMNFYKHQKTYSLEDILNYEIDSAEYIGVSRVIGSERKSVTVFCTDESFDKVSKILENMELKYENKSDGSFSYNDYCFHIAVKGSKTLISINENGMVSDNKNIYKIQGDALGELESLLNSLLDEVVKW